MFKLHYNCVREGETSRTDGDLKKQHIERELLEMQEEDLLPFFVLLCTFTSG